MLPGFVGSLGGTGSASALPLAHQRDQLARADALRHDDKENAAAAAAAWEPRPETAETTREGAAAQRRPTTPPAAMSSSLSLIAEYADSDEGRPTDPRATNEVEDGGSAALDGADAADRRGAAAEAPYKRQRVEGSAAPE